VPQVLHHPQLISMCPCSNLSTRIHKRYDQQQLLDFKNNLNLLNFIKKNYFINFVTYLYGPTGFGAIFVVIIFFTIWDIFIKFIYFLIVLFNINWGNDNYQLINNEEFFSALTIMNWVLIFLLTTTTLLFSF